MCGVLGVPTELMGSAHATHAANVEMSMRVLGKTVTALQEFLVPILGDLCDKYHQQSLDEWIDGSKEKTRYDPTTDRMEGNKFIPTHGEPTQADMSREPEIPTLSKQIHLTKLMGTPMVLDEDGQVRHPKFGLAKPPAVASDEQMEELRPYVRFRVTFKRSLLTDVDSIIMAYDQYCMINWHELTTEYSDITGMDPSKMLDEKTRLAEMEKKLKFAHEMATKYPLAPPLPIMGQPATGKGPAAEQKKQPAAPPGPSKKKSEKKPSAKKTEAGKPSTTGASSSSSKKRKK